MTYLEWNHRLVGHFFSPGKAGRKVYLFATHELIEKLGEASGDGFDGFVEAVRVGPPWVHRTGFCQRAVEAHDGWRGRRLEYPPYVAYLALFVIAAGLEDGSPPHAYYPRLRKVLGEEPEARPLPSFDKMLTLWDDLERWSNVDKEGEFGIFQLRWLGNLINVGVPRAQTLLSEEELRQLPLIFFHAGLDPTAIPSEREIAKIVILEGKRFLRNRTLRSLKSSAESDSEIRQALIEAIVEELREWSGESFEEPVGGEDDGRRFSGTLRLCCDLDRTSGRARMIFRCRTAGEFPEDGLVLRPVRRGSNTRTNPDSELVCEEWGRGWSCPLTSSSAEVDAARFDWTEGFNLEEIEGNWRFRFRGSGVRIFVDGSGEGLPGLVEVRRLPSQSKFLLLAAGSDAARLVSWGSVSCDGWEELPILGGLPPGWRAFNAKKARNDAGIRDDYPALALPEVVLLSLRGGIRVSRGNRYFDFAAPCVVVEGQNIDVLLFNGREVESPNKAGQFEIPHNLPELPGDEPGRVLIEVRRGDQTLDRRTIYLARGGWAWTSTGDGYGITALGESVVGDGGIPVIRGAVVEGVIAPEFDFAGAMPVAEYGSVRYVGREPGQIVQWPAEPMPKTWSPVWVIVSRRRGEVVFCGTNPADAAPIRCLSRDRKRLNDWRDYLWTRRRQLRPPAHVALRRLWQKYQEMARDV